MTQKTKLSGFFCDYATGECFKIDMKDKEAKDVNTDTTKRNIHEH